jgi:hypothetical protein
VHHRYGHRRDGEGGCGVRTRRDMLAFSAGAVAAKTVLPMAARAGGVVSKNETPFVHPDAAVLAALGEFDGNHSA